MTNFELVPDLDWLSLIGELDDNWIGPGPALPNIRVWMQTLSDKDHHLVVAATFAAAKVALPNWKEWLSTSHDFALEAILEAKTPIEQLDAVAKWLASPTDELKSLARETVDSTKQLHWFNNEYADSWFELPGMWAVESCEHCVLTLTGDPYSYRSLNELASIAVISAVNSMRQSETDGIRNSLFLVYDQIRKQIAG